MEESILILGAGTMQGPAIRAAKGLGLKVFVVDANPAAPLVKEADRFEQIDLKDRDAIARYALALKESDNLKAVFTAGTDFSANVAYACEQCGFPTHSYEAAVNASNKALMRQCFRNARVPSPHFIKIEKKDKNNILTDKVIESLKYPLVMKPVDNMGARGCRMVRSREELNPALEDAFDNSRSQTAILEEYMEGPEFSIDALVYNGTLTITGFAKRHIFFPPYFIEMGHTMPMQLPYNDYFALIKTFAQGIRSLGLSHGAAKADIKLTPQGPMVGEIAARLSGGYMSGWTYPYSCGLDLTEQAILVALGRKPEKLEEGRYPLNLNEPYKTFAYVSRVASAERAWISMPGKVKEILHLEKAKNMEGVRDVLPRVMPGDEVDFPRSNVEKCGNVISVGRTREIASKIAENAASEIILVMEKDNPKTEEFLYGDRDPDGNHFPPRAYQISKSEASNLVYELECNSEKRIPAGESIQKYIPSKIQMFMELRDWNNLTLQETIERFDKLCPNHGEMNYKKFWTALMRGGVQGALYYAQ